jgi:cytochrome c peroxidase
VALAAWQDSHEVNSFSSKLDQALAKARAACAPNCPQVPSFPLAGLTEQENRGHDLFYANCAFFCHNSGNPVPQTGGNKTDWENELYTGHGYFNIGTPANLEIPGYDPNNPDLGLFEHTQIFGHEGLHKAPTMRNVDLRPSKSFVKAYTHNGWFKSLKSLVHFYNKRDVLPECPPGITTEKQALKHNCWPKPEVAENVFTTAGPPFSFGIGDMGLSDEDEDAIVAYLKTLTDRYTPKAPKPYK